ncbi:hypothetical protein HMI54_004748 [Coelomomyces lativittatus]|nr:hypothetical protein HMI54_004748 [Coelomomyces lativittatus]KAJ1511885.1 hypothetical protein HMI56_004819 [Coelomomyces lativittatus]KAJ1511916.1 hypothetical protein HMI55_006423 [Coelomomyces lativittatus]
MNATAGFPFPPLNLSTEYSEDYQYPLNASRAPFEEYTVSTLSESAFSNLTLTSSIPNSDFFSVPSQNTYSTARTGPSFLPSNEQRPFEEFQNSLRQPVLSLPHLHLSNAQDMSSSSVREISNELSYPNDSNYSSASANSFKSPAGQASSPHSEFSTNSNSNSNSMLPSFRRYSVLDDILNTPVHMPRRASLPTPFFPSIYMDAPQSGISSGLMFSNVSQSPMYEHETSNSFAPIEKVENWLHHETPSYNHQLYHTSLENMNGSPAASRQQSRRTSILPNASGEYTCPYPYCRKTFSRSHNLKSHMVMHSNAKPFQCPYCPLAFRRNHDLRRHVRLHSGLKPFSCTRCGKSFSRSDALKRHTKIDFCTDANGDSLLNEAN